MALTKVTGHVVLPTTNIEFHNTKSTGIVTFTDTTQSTSTTTGALQIAGGVGIVKNLNVGGNLNVTGNISYTDVDNINSTGIITAAGGINVTGGNVAITNNLDVDGLTELDNVSIAGITTISGTSPTLDFTETDGNPDYRLIGNGGLFKIQNLLSGTYTSIFTINTDGHVDIAGNTDFAAGIDVTGNATFVNDIDVDGHTELDNLNVAGVSTFAGNVSVGKTTNAGKPLEVYQTGDAAIRIQNNASGTGNNDGILLEIGNTSKDALIYNYESAHMRFGTAGTERVRITSTGLVGIGSATPSSDVTLTVNRDVAEASGNATMQINNLYQGTANQSNASGAEIEFKFKNHNAAHNWWGGRILCSNTDNYNQYSHLQFHTASQGNAVERMRLDHDGDLILYGKTNAELKLKCGTSSSDNIIAFINSSGTTKGRILYDSDNNFMSFSTDGTASSNERLRITSDGKVGINKTNPEQELHIVGDSDACVRLTCTDGGVASFQLGDASDTVIGGITLDSSDNSIQIRGNNNSERLRIASTGEIGVGMTQDPPTGSFTVRLTETPEFNLYSTQHAQNNNCKINFGVGQSASADGNTGARIEMNIPNAGGQMTGELKFHTNQGDSLQERLRITSAGKVGIGTVNPGRQFDVIDSFGGGIGVIGGNAGIYLGTHHTGGFQVNAAIARAAANNYHITGSAVGDLCIAGESEADIIIGTSVSAGAMDERIRIQSDGKIGIFDNSPVSKVTINNGTGDSQFVQLKNDNVGLFFGTYGTGHASYPREATINGSRVDSGSSPYLRVAGQGGIRFCVDLNSERMRIDSGGKIKLFPATETTGATGTPLYLQVQSDMTAPNTPTGGSDCTGLFRIEERGGTNNRYHGIDLRNRNSGDVRILNQDVAANNGANLIFAVDDGAQFTGAGTIREYLRIASNGVTSAKTLSGSYYPVASTRDGSTSQRAATSAWEIKKTLGPAARTGYYYLKDTTGTVAQWWCDMTTDGGGWILIAHSGEGELASQSTSGDHWWDAHDRGGFNTIGTGYKQGGGYWRGSGGAWAENTCGQLMWDVRTHGSQYDNYGNAKVVFNWGTDQAIPTGNSGYGNIPDSANRNFHNWCYEVVGAPGFNPSNYDKDNRDNTINGGNHFTEHMAITWCFRGTGGGGDDGDSGPYWMIGSHHDGLHQHYEEGLSGSPQGIYGSGGVYVVSNEDTGWGGGGSNGGYPRIGRHTSEGTVNIWMR